MKQQNTIGEPSLHDWEHEKFIGESDAKDDALEYYTKTFKSNLCVDFRSNHFEKIESVMGDVLEGVFDDVPKTEQFYRALFALCINPNGESRALVELIDKELEKVIEKEFEKAAKERDE